MQQAAEDAAALSSRAIPDQQLTLMEGTGVDAMRKLVEQSAGDKDGEAPAVVLPCSCGHVFMARDRG